MDKRKQRLGIAIAAALVSTGLAATAGWATLGQAPAAAPAYDLVIEGGRVIDPESGLDAVRSIGIRDGRVVAISDATLAGKARIDARGLVVAPGFIDVHSHAQTIPGGWMQAFDGVTTALELETGRWPIDANYRAAAAEGRPINYGYSVSWGGLRSELMGARAKGLATDAEIKQVLAKVTEGLDAGGLGVGTPVGYWTETNRTEYWDVAALAAKRNVPMFTHVRSKNARDPHSAVEAFGEVIATAATTGAHMHLCHINSSGLRDIPRLNRMIAKARSYGVPVTSEAYPWGAGSTSINAPFLQPKNLPLVDIKSSNIEVVATGERPATDERLAELQRQNPNARIIVHYLNEAVEVDRRLIEQAVLLDDGLIASDAVNYSIGTQDLEKATWPLPANAAGHPRTAATFTKVLGEYVRDRRLLSLTDAIRRSTLLPAKLMEPVAPGMKRKGRINMGSDADIVVFDPATVGAAATYAKPTLPSRGMRYVLVGGSFVIRDGKLLPDARPGKPVRGSIAK
ncbi:amidohydrolase family protein [Sphingomonas sp.]|uniref:amidohydrolase family protein n=1 Tax=Sphingomonas sp. TaxID=28214 RepID=UPI002DD662A7|nr:amidohydrolase family protein [Sphingomonas sp.]